MVARLVARTQTMHGQLSRPLYAADAHSDIHALVRVLPDAEGASLEISDWRAGPTRQPLAPALPEAAASPRGWTGERDAQLRLVALRAGAEAVPTQLGSPSCGERVCQHV